ncbi:MAG: hypothetical protein ACOC7O_01435 [Thermoplasmatota archaeon]
MYISKVGIIKSKVLVIIATEDKEKSLTGLMYAKNAVENDWLKDIKVIFFESNESLMVKDEEIRNYALYLSDMTDTFACKYLSDKNEISDEIEELGVNLEYFGSIISDYINDRYTPMVW